MGAWGFGYFQNDDAADLLGELIGEANWGAAERAVDAVLGVGDGYLEAPESSAAIGAAALIAARAGTLAADLDVDDAKVINGMPVAPAALVAKAKAALARILKQSELADLWNDAGEKDAWHACVVQLESAL